MEKICSVCNRTKEENTGNFRRFRSPNGIVYFRSMCKVCEKEYGKRYAQTHKEERNENAKKFREANPLYIRTWKEDNKNRVRERENKRRKKDIGFRLKKNISRAIGHAIVKSGNSTIKFLPYTVDELKSHLEAQFNENMTWENYGSYWHVDHIIPHSLFDYKSMEDRQFKACWALSNLRPLEASKNRLDGATRIRHKKE